MLLLLIRAARNRLWRKKATEVWYGVWGRSSRRLWLFWPLNCPNGTAIQDWTELDLLLGYETTIWIKGGKGDKEGIFKDSSCASVVPVIESGDALGGHSCFSHLMTGLLQCSLHRSTFRPLRGYLWSRMQVTTGKCWYALVTLLLSELHCLPFGFRYNSRCCLLPKPFIVFLWHSTCI